MKILITLIFLAALPAHAADPRELAEKLEKSGREVLCDGAEAALRGLLDKAWDVDKAHDTFVKACNGNPRAKDLFPGSTPAGIATKTAAYCEFRPALRLCMVCRLLTKSSPDLRSAADACSGEFRDGERADFNSQVLGIPAETPKDPEAGQTDAR